jgi:LmbE family N-acetylglucosaminyl deacetylase
MSKISKILFFALFLFLSGLYISPKIFKQIYPHLSQKTDDCRNLLIAFAHTDDELTNAGLIRYFADFGSRITLIVLTDGAANRESEMSACLKGETITDCRKRELRDVGLILGLENIVFGNLPDSRLQNAISEATEIVSNEITLRRPNCILTMEASGLNGSADHRAAHEAVKRALNKHNFSGKVYLSTLPWPLRFFLPSSLPGNSTTEIRTFSLNKRLTDIKIKTSFAHKSQATTIRNITLGMGPHRLFSWLDFETYSVHNGSDLLE